ncbi:MAG: tRNA (adenine-N1)-methyltransferase [Anaerolineaceae bacterium]|nr:tRNA (adenine-N1)-methyltransferase [Anaerolineaceae bacterium]
MSEVSDKHLPSLTKAGDLIQLVGLSHKSFILSLTEDAVFHTHRGILNHNDLIGKPWGSQVLSHNGSPFFILQPSLSDVLRNTKRATQIMYPKEIGYILLYMGIHPGSRVIEAGTGSGSFTTALALAIGETGKVYSYERKPEHQLVAQRSLKSLGLLGSVELKARDIVEGFDEKDVDAIFLDLPNPYDYLKQVRESLKPGGHFGCIVPTANQVMRVLVALRRNEFAFIEVCDVSVRFYKTEPSRFRPTDRMIAHTGYLIFARPILLGTQDMDDKLLKEIGLITSNDEILDQNEDFLEL